MVGLSGSEFWVVRLLFQRGLASIYLLAFLVAARQFRPLAGVDGLLPLQSYLERRSVWDGPSLFQWFSTDRAIGMAAWVGVGLASLAVLGAPGWLPGPFVVPASMLLWTSMWLLYLSFVNAGQLFYGYGWESMLLETGALAIFLGAGDVATPAIVIWLLRWVLFRDMFGAGLIKLRGDPCWRTLTCLDYHYETQPMPNPVSWFAHHLPDRFHRLETFGSHILEVVIPFLYFAPQPVAALAGLGTIGFQGWLMFTGNFSWLNALTIVLALSTFTDPVLGTVLPLTAPTQTTTPVPLLGAALLYAVVVLALSVGPVRNMLTPAQRMNTAFDPLHLVNSYGAFGSITKTRYELVIQGTRSDAVDDATDWRTYEIPGKPTDPSERPPQIAPYHHRLGWQLWFAAMSPRPRRSPWMYSLVESLLQADAGTRSLLDTDPFGDDPPTYVRVLRYRYRFTTPSERASTGDWWGRERVGTYIDATTLDTLHSGRRSGRRR